MKCPSCGYNNIPGEDLCVSCQSDLMALDGVVPKSKFERILMEDPLSKLKPKDAVSVPETTSILDAIKTMNEIKSGCVFVENTRGEMVGIVTERDVLLRAVGKFPDLAKGKVSQVMTTRPTSLDEDDSLAYALHEMSVNRYRHLPILRKGKKPGVITARDVLNYLAKLFP